MVAVKVAATFSVSTAPTVQDAGTDVAGRSLPFASVTVALFSVSTLPDTVTESALRLVATSAVSLRSRPAVPEAVAPTSVEFTQFSERTSPPTSAPGG